MTYSIITVTWNNLTGIKSTWESIRNLDYSDYEWIVIDGASTDGTKEWLQANANEKCHWISEKDNGIFDAMNKGIELSKGEYMIFMNAGDEFYDASTLSKVTKEVARCIQKPYFIYGDAIDFTVDQTIFLKKAKHHTSLPKTMFTSHQSMFFNRQFGENHLIKYPLQYKITGDYAYISLYFRNIKDPSRILYLAFPFCRFLLGGTNEIHRFKAIKEDFRIRREIMEMNYFRASFLYILHYSHTMIKKALPSLSRSLRYKNVK